MRFVIAACAFVLSISLDVNLWNDTKIQPTVTMASQDAESVSHEESATALRAGAVSSHAKSSPAQNHVTEPRGNTTDLAPGAARREVSIDEVCQALAVAAEDNGLPVSFFARLIWQESKFRADAVSPVGAKGVAQFMPATAAEHGLDDPFDPLKAIPASARFLGQLHRQFGNLGLAAAAYNAGSGRIQNWLARRGPLPAETKTYVQTITGEDATNWTQESRTIALQTHLPRNAPCEGVAGLSRGKQAATIVATLAPAMSELVKKARAEAARVAALAKKKRVAKTRIAAARNKKEKTIAARPASTAKLRVASADAR